MLPPGAVGCANMWDAVEHVGGGTVSDGGGIDTSRVVDVPRERMASPGFERVTIVDGLSPVNGATIHSTNRQVSE